MNSEIRHAAASDKAGAVMVSEINGRLCVNRYAPRSLGEPYNEQRFQALVNRAAGKLGWKRDRRSRGGWRNTHG